MNFVKRILFTFMVTNFFLFAEEGVVLIDNFGGVNLQKNFLDKKTFTFVSNKQLVFNLEKNKNGVKDECLKVEYNVNPLQTNISGSIVRQIDDMKQKVEYSETSTFAGYFTEVSGIDFTKYDYLVLYIKGDKEKGYSRSLKLELKDRRTVASYVLEGITDEWQKFVIPISVFSEVNLKRASFLGILFQSELLTKKEGVVYIDEVSISKKSFVKQQKIKINKTKSQIIIDGELSDWKDEKWYSLDINNNLEMGKISASQDLDTKFSLSWDESYLYIATKITDNEIVSREIGRDIWRDDCVEIYLDPQNDGIVWGSEKDYQIGISPSGPNNEPQIYAFFQDKIPTKDEIYYEVGNYKNGYSIELRIRWDFLSFNPKENDKFGFSISVQDVDDKDGSSGKISYCLVKDIDKNFLAEVRLK